MHSSRTSRAFVAVAALAAALATLAAQPTQASAKPPGHVTLAQASASLPATVPALKWTLGSHGAFHESVNLTACGDGAAPVRVKPYVDAEYDGPVTNYQRTGFVVVAVFPTPPKASHALAALQAQASHCPDKYAPPF